MEGATERPNKRKDSGKAITDFFRGGADVKPPGKKTIMSNFGSYQYSACLHFVTDALGQTFQLATFQ